MNWIESIFWNNYTFDRKLEYANPIWCRLDSLCAYALCIRKCITKILVTLLCASSGDMCWCCSQQALVTDTDGWIMACWLSCMLLVGGHAAANKLQPSEWVYALYMQYIDRSSFVCTPKHWPWCWSHRLPFYTRPATAIEYCQCQWHANAELCIAAELSKLPRPVAVLCLSFTSLPRRSDRMYLI